MAIKAEQIIKACGGRENIIIVTLDDPNTLCIDVKDIFLVDREDMEAAGATEVRTGGSTAKVFIEGVEVVRIQEEMNKILDVESR